MIWLAIRLLVGVMGILFTLVFAQIWIDPTELASRQFQLDAYTNLGIASLRADMGAFFGVSALLCFAAAFRNKATWLTAPIMLFALALSGRVFTYMVNGNGPGMLQPVLVEIGIIVLLLVGRFGLGKE